MRFAILRMTFHTSGYVAVYYGMYDQSCVGSLLFQPIRVPAMTVYTPRAGFAQAIPFTKIMEVVQVFMASKA
jgi:hypothetical protein